MKIVPAALTAAVLGSALFAAAPDTPPAVAADATPPPAATVSVDTKNFAYVPATITIHPGDTIVFKNSDAIAHTVTASDKSFTSGEIDQGQTWSHVFATAGTYAYTCAYHAYMQGTVVVR